MAGRIPREFINNLIERTDIVSIIEQRLPLKRRGTNFLACCPFHQEKTPSFTVSHTKQFYHCFGCGESGNVLKFLMDYDHLSFPEAVEDLAREMGLDVPYEAVQNNINNINHSDPFSQSNNSNNSNKSNKQILYTALKNAERFYRTILKQPESKKTIDYIKNRGISGQTAQKYGIGFAPDQWDALKKALKNTPDPVLISAGLASQSESSSNRIYDRFRNRLMFPIRNKRGQTIGFGGRVLESKPDDHSPKYLNSPETPVFQKGRELYGLYELLQNAKTTQSNKLDFIMVTEGYMDVVALSEKGFINSVATLGTATTEDHLRVLLRYTPHIIFCFDGDKAGKSAAIRALNTTLRFMSGKYTIEFLFLPDGEDPDSMIKQLDLKDFINYIQKNTESLSTVLINHLTQHLDLAKLEQRAQFLHEFKDYYSKIPEGAFCDLLIDHISKLLNLSSAHILNTLNPSQAKSNSNFTNQSGSNFNSKIKSKKFKSNTFSKSFLQKPTPKLPSLLDKAKTMIIHQPQLVFEYKDLLKNFFQNLKYNPEKYNEIKLLSRIIYSQKIENTGQLLTHLKTSEGLNQTLSIEPNLSPDQNKVVKQEFSDIIKRLESDSMKDSLKFLTEKSRTQGLSNQEKTTLQNLLLKLKTTH